MHDAFFVHAKEAEAFCLTSPWYIPTRKKDIESRLPLLTCSHGQAELRFEIGHRVVCNTGEWVPGVIIKHHYREKSWPEGKIVPYRIKLDDGRSIFAPIDDDRVIRSSDAPPPPPPAEEISDAEKLPVTVITGFLGAGKTTLVSFPTPYEKGASII